MFHINRRTVVIAASTSIISGFVPAFISAAAEKESVKYLMLPAAGVDYVLSGERISLRDIELVEAERARVLAEAVMPAAEETAEALQTVDTAGADPAAVEAIPAEGPAAAAAPAETATPAETAAPAEQAPMAAGFDAAASAAAAVMIDEAQVPLAAAPEAQPEQAGTEAARENGAAAGNTAGAVEAIPEEEMAEHAAGGTAEVQQTEMPAEPAQAPAEETAAPASVPDPETADTKPTEAKPAETKQTEMAAAAGTVTEAPAASAVEKILIEPVMSQTQREAVAASAPQPEQPAEGTDTASSASAGCDIAVAMVSDFVYMRAQPSTDAEVVGKLYANGVGHIVGEEKDGWVPVRSGNVTGYVKAQFLFVGEGARDLADEVAVTKATVTTETLRVRVAADINSDVITLIPGGETFDVISTEDGWIKVDTPEGMGYISADYADVEQVYPEAESKAQEEARLAAEARKREEEKAAEAARQRAIEAERKAEAARQAARAAQEASAANAAAMQQQADAATAAAAAAQQAAIQAQKVAAASAGSAQGQAVANFALQFVGNPYVWGGSSLTNGTDCSGFTMAVYSNFGVSLPHYDASQRNYGVAVGSLAEAAPGDLVCYNGHVGIYIGGGQIVHASNPRDGIKVSNAGYRSIVAIRRIFN